MQIQLIKEHLGESWHSSPVSSVQFSSVTQSYLTLCDPMNRSKPGLPLRYHLPQFTQTQKEHSADFNIQGKDPNGLLYQAKTSQVRGSLAGNTEPLKSKYTRMLSLALHMISSVTQSYLTLCDPMDWSMPGFPVHHQLSEFTQIHVYLISDAIQPSHPLLSPSPPAWNLSQHQGLFQWVCSSHQVAKVLEHCFCFVP